MENVTNFFYVFQQDAQVQIRKQIERTTS